MKITKDKIEEAARAIGNVDVGPKGQSLEYYTYPRDLVAIAHAAAIAFGLEITDE